MLAVASTGDEQYVGGLGAKHVLARTATAEELTREVRTRVPGGVDAVYDAASLGGPVIAAVRDGGEFVGVLPYALTTAERGIRVQWVEVKPDAAALRDLVDAFTSGRLSTRVAATMPLDRVADAHTRAATPGRRGKVVLLP